MKLESTEIGDLQHDDFLFSFSVSTVGAIVRYSVKWLKGDRLYELFSDYEDAQQYLIGETERYGVVPYEEVVAESGYYQGFESFDNISELLRYVAELTEVKK